MFHFLNTKDNIYYYFIYFRVTFERENSFFYNSKDVTIDSVENLNILI